MVGITPGMTITSMKYQAIDVIIVTKNRYAQLKECISCLIKGSVKPQHIVLIDSSAVVDKEALTEALDVCRRSLVKLIYRNIPDLGVAHSRNVGLRLVKSPLFGFIDDDEYVPINLLAHIVRFFATHKSIHVVCGPTIPRNMANYWNIVWYWVNYRWYFFEGAFDFLPVGNSFFRTVLFRKHRLSFDERLRKAAEDRALYLAIRKLEYTIYFSYRFSVYHDFRTTLSGFMRQWFAYGEGFHRFHVLYCQSGTMQEKKRVRQTVANLFTVWPIHAYATGLSGWFIAPGLVVLNVCCIFGYLFSYSFYKK